MLRGIQSLLDFYEVPPAEIFKKLARLSMANNAKVESLEKGTAGVVAH